jgi:hypothetical protein
MPNAYRGRDKNGNEVLFQSYNAFNFKLQDERGNPLYFKDDKTARIKFPVASKSLGEDAYFWEFEDDEWIQRDEMTSNDVETGFFETYISRSGWYNIDEEYDEDEVSGTLMDGEKILKNAKI